MNVIIQKNIFSSGAFSGTKGQALLNVPDEKAKEWIKQGWVKEDKAKK